MQSSDVQIHTGSVNVPFKRVGSVEARRSAATAFSPAPSIEEVNEELRLKAAQLFANAVIDVEYSRGMSLVSYKVLKAKGVAVILEKDEVDCRFCAEKVKRAAVKCKHCGSDLSA